MKDQEDVDVFVFSLEREEQPITLTSKEGGSRRLVIREMDGKDRDSYFTKIGNKMNLSPSGKVLGIKSFDGLQSGLLSLCLFDETNKLVPVQEIQAYPAKVQGELFKIAQRINGLDQKAEDESKNESEEND